MLKYIKLLIYIIFIGIIVFGCRTKKIGIAIDANKYIMPENRIPDITISHIVDTFFQNWSIKCIPIDSIEFSNLDSLSKFGYLIYEEIILNNYLRINQRYFDEKYILLPNTLNFGYADNYNIEFDVFLYENYQPITIENFRPRIFYEDKNVIYYTKEYQQKLPEIAEKYGLKGYLYMDSFLMNGRLRYYETSPFIKDIVFIKEKDEYVVSFDYKDTYNIVTLKKNPDGSVKMDLVSVVFYD